MRTMMATGTVKPSTDQMYDAIRTAGGYKPAVRLLKEQGYKISEGTIRLHTKKEKDFVVELPPEEIDVEELITRRVSQFAKKERRHEAERLIPVRINLQGPIGIGFFGDPHVDDDGTDLKTLFGHADLFDGRNEGLFGACIGDLTNNWGGRLARLFEEQSINGAETLALAREFLMRPDWLFVIKGNHDLMRANGDLIDLFLKDQTVVKDWRIRIGLRFPNDRMLKIYAAHTFPGRSMYTNVYGAMKKGVLDGNHHIYACGHTHISGYTHGWSESNQILWHAIQIAAYKKIDSYADEIGADNQNFYQCPVALIDPEAKDQINFIRWEFDPFEAAERLAWMRKRWRG